MDLAALLGRQSCLMTFRSDSRTYIRVKPRMSAPVQIVFHIAANHLKLALCIRIHTVKIQKLLKISLLLNQPQALRKHKSKHKGDLVQVHIHVCPGYLPVDRLVFHDLLKSTI